jgi:hypothetical protein
VIASPPAWPFIFRSLRLSLKANPTICTHLTRSLSFPPSLDYSPKLCFVLMTCTSSPSSFPPSCFCKTACFSCGVIAVRWNVCRFRIKKTIYASLLPSLPPSLPPTAHPHRRAVATKEVYTSSRIFTHKQAANHSCCYYYYRYHATQKSYSTSSRSSSSLLQQQQSKRRLPSGA